MSLEEYMSKINKKMLSKIFKSKQKESIKMELKEKEAAPVPRSRDEINKSYEQVCIQIGDKTVKKAGLEQELGQLFKYVESLGNELAAREKLDKDSADQAPVQASVSESSGSPEATA
jgi:hypothetical protein